MLILGVSWSQSEGQSAPMITGIKDDLTPHMLWQWYVPCRDLHSLDASSDSSPVDFCCLRYSLNNMSLGAILMIYSLIISVSSKIMSLMLTTPGPLFLVHVQPQGAGFWVDSPCTVRSFVVFMSVISISYFQLILDL